MANNVNDEKSYKACYTYTDEEILIALKNLAGKLGRTPRAREVDLSEECPSTWVYYSRFGTLTNAIRLVGLKPNKITKAEAMKKYLKVEGWEITDMRWEKPL